MAQSFANILDYYFVANICICILFFYTQTVDFVEGYYFKFVKNYGHINFVTIKNKEQKERNGHRTT